MAAIELEGLTTYYGDVFAVGETIAAERLGSFTCSRYRTT